MKVIADIASGNQAAIDKAYGEGIHVAGVRYVLTRTGDDVYARAVRPRSRASSFTLSLHVHTHSPLGTILICVVRAVMVFASPPPRQPLLSAFTMTSRWPETPPRSLPLSPITLRRPDINFDRR